MRGGAALLMALGLAQMAGDLLGLPALRGLAAATTASPAPKVFSAVDGLETYSIRFALEWDDASGGVRSLPITREAYSRIRGPYNRRNVFGAVVAYGPVLVESPVMRPVFLEVARHALCGEAPLLRELGLDPAVVSRPRIRLEPLPDTDMRGRPSLLEVPCPAAAGAPS